MGKVYALKGDKRRGGARDDSDVYIYYNRQELFAMLQQIEYRCRRYVENDDETSTIKPPTGVISNNERSARKRHSGQQGKQRENGEKTVENAPVRCPSSQGGKRHENGYKCQVEVPAAVYSSAELSCPVR